MRDDPHTLGNTVTDPQPQYASAEEIALAERLRRQIEDRYLNGNGTTKQKRAVPGPFQYRHAA